MFVNSLRITMNRLHAQATLFLTSVEWQASKVIILPKYLKEAEYGNISMLIPITLACDALDLPRVCVTLLIIFSCLGEVRAHVILQQLQHHGACAVSAVASAT